MKCRNSVTEPISGGGAANLRSLSVFHQQKKGFTLAEVLITLGIIGIVASMTLPALIQKKSDKEIITMTKKIYSDLNNALLLVQKDYGVIGDNSFLFNTNDDAQVVAKNLAKYFSGSKVCANSTQKGCNKYYYNVKYAYNHGTTVSNGDIAKIILSNGAVIRVQTNKTGCTTANYDYVENDNNGNPIKNPDGSDNTTSYSSDICANLTFDVNGYKLPNRLGYDVYNLWIYRDRVTHASDYVGGASLKNILTGKDKFEYDNGVKFNFAF